MTENKASAGWYPDGNGAMRWWDGFAWTDNLQTALEPTEVVKEVGKKSTWQRLSDKAAEVQATQARGSKDPDVQFRGQVELGVTVTIFRDGTFVVKRGRSESTRDRLVSVEHGNDSMRRKSVTGRGAAAIATGGLSLGANNNRGVVYLRFVGETTGLHSWTKRNPTNNVLNAMRSLKAAADAVLATGARSTADTWPVERPDTAAQLDRLNELHQSGALTDAEYVAAKARTLS
jgi:hypothetical protein